MNNEKKVSIIIPVYNVEKYLAECLDSIINQTYNNIEIILVDDGSKDNSGSICDHYAEKDSRITVIHKKNGGLSDARNAGIDVATGEYITFIDSDDLISIDYVSDMTSSAMKHNADIVQCQFSRDIKALGKSTENSEVELRNENILHRYLRLEEPNVLACAKLYKRNIFNELRFPVGIIDEDNFTTYKTMYVANVFIQLNKILYFYRDNPASITNRAFNPEKFGIIKSADDIRTYLGEDAYRFESDIDYYKLRHILQLYNQAIRADSIDRYKDQFDELKKEIPNIKYSLHSNEWKYKAMVFCIEHLNKLYQIVVKAL